MNRHMRLIFIALLQIIWIFGGYTLRVKKHLEIVQSDFLLFSLPLIVTPIFFGLVFYHFYFEKFSPKIQRIIFSSVFAVICDFFSFWIAMLLGVNLYGE
jgi:hypothetical protein